jgi:hypothetical protein
MVCATIVGATIVGATIVGVGLLARADVLLTAL